MDVEPATHGFGLFGEDFGYPGGGLCLSVFLAVERDGELLTGRMDEERAQRWTEAWAPNLAYYEGERRARLFDGWRFPATYLRVGEEPQTAAERVWRDQLGFEGAPRLGSMEVSSSSQPSRRTPDHEHWDVLFAFAVEGPSLASEPEHWASLDYRDPGGLADEPGVMMHGDLVGFLTDLGDG
jgi:ADP-ribose pyrophosphatase YjhB (NUDIX family)